MAIIGTASAIAEALALGLKLIMNNIDDPAKRARAVRDYVNGLVELREKLGDTKDAEEIDKIILAIIAARP